MDVDDTSNDVVAINSDDDDDSSPNSDKPIIQLFKKLITYDSKENTVLTNAQIVHILHKEFGINILELHELEGDIYLTIMKKYLKEWPQWDELDRIIVGLKSKNKNADINKTLESNYIDLKNYLKIILDASRDMVIETIQKVVDAEPKSAKDQGEGNGDNIVLEVRSTRNQLNQLFFNRPNPNLNLTVFNHIFSVRTQIQLDTLPLEAILNWWGVIVSIVNQTNSSFFYTRIMKHELKHVLINRKIVSKQNIVTPLDQDLKVLNAKFIPRDLSEYIKIVDTMKSESITNKEIYDFIKKDLSMLPKKIFSRVTYKRYTNKYPYVRYLCKEVKSKDKTDFNKYDLRLEETVKPMYKVHLGNALPIKLLIVECGPCSIKFKGDNLIPDLKAHFEDVHNSEPDWTCTNCNLTFQMSSLAENWWSHRC